MKKAILVVSLVFTFSVSSAFSAEQVSQEQVDHFKLVKTGTVQVSQSAGEISSPSDLNSKLSVLTDAKGAKYYRIIAAGMRGTNVMGIAEIYKDAEK
ncbi:DUF1471 domain-containing protein [Serratia surfactantfaciens]|uniref:DUF1471 domain-containing protein n=1 Tax=Serratia surfactantfaciens TaxID=2741499 RepID=UPI0018E412BA|nr:DUF1471 domain-containing protein [Serratia surfactantfaciens]MBI6152201.1 DUF1471 domain-containing protein [Serratia surfactantfaciens]